MSECSLAFVSGRMTDISCSGIKHCNTEQEQTNCVLRHQVLMMVEVDADDVRQVQEIQTKLRRRWRLDCIHLVFCVINGKVSFVQARLL